MADKDKELYSYKDALEQPHWIRNIGSFYRFSSAFKFSRIIYMLLVFMPSFVLMRWLKFIPLNYSVILSLTLGLIVALYVEDLKIDGRLFIFYFKDYLGFYYKYGRRGDKIYINKGKVYKKIGRRYL